jgi:hypothetical protein
MTFRRVAAFAVIAFLPLISSIIFGYSGHDLPFHLGTWLDLRANWEAHTFFPAWASLANHTLGDARFCFYPPVSYLFAGVLSQVFPLRLVVGAYIWFALFGAGISMYVASREFAAERDRFAIACLYMLSPYLLVTALVRFAAAELLVQAWLPLIVACFVRSQLQVSPRRAWQATLWLGLLLGLSWLTNLPASIVLAYVLAIASAWVAWRARSVAPLLRCAVAQAAGIGISAVRLVPAFLDKKWISSTQILAYDFRQNFLIHPRPFLAFLVFCVLAAWLGAGLVVMAWRTEQVRSTPPMMLLALLGSLAFLFEMPVSYPLWRYLPELAFVQFPFRFLSLTGVVTATLIVGVTQWRRFRKVSYTVAVAVAVAIAVGQQALNFMLHRSPAPIAETLAQMSSGYTGVPEYVPAGAPEGQRSEGRGNAELAATVATDDSACSVRVRDWKPARRVLETVGDQQCRVRLATFAFPYWHARSDDGAPLVNGADQNGWLLLDVPAGHHVISMVFDAETSARTLSRLLSCAVAFASIVALTLLRLSKSRWSRVEVD